jgi:hypothetical protein
VAGEINDDGDDDDDVAEYLEVGPKLGGRRPRNSLDLSASIKFSPSTGVSKPQGAKDTSGAPILSTPPGYSATLDVGRGLGLDRHSSDSDLSDLGVPDPEPPSLHVPALAAMQGGHSPHLPHALRRLQQKLDAELASLVVPPPPPPPRSQSPDPSRNTLLEHHDSLDAGEV